MQKCSAVDIWLGTEYTYFFYYTNLLPKYRVQYLPKYLSSFISNIHRYHQVLVKFRAFYSYAEAKEKVGYQINWLISFASGGSFFKTKSPLDISAKLTKK